jgi:threonine dehydratase
MTMVPSPADIEEAAGRIAGLVRTTPVVDYAYAKGRVAALKLELFQHAGSFKPRGAFTTVLSAAERPQRLVAASGGNHGLAVAHVGAVLGIPTEIHVPTTAPAVKVGGIRGRGAEVVQTGDKYADALTASQDAARQAGVLAVHAYDALGTVTGQGTVGREIELQVPDVDTVLVAVGGGGLIGGICAWFSGRARIVAVEPATCPTLHEALRAGEPVTVSVGGVAADALGASRIGDIGFAAARAAGVQSVLVDETAIVEARSALWHDLRIAAEPAGATALAALRTGAYEPREDETVCVVVCGGNADPADLG